MKFQKNVFIDEQKLLEIKPENIEALGLHDFYIHIKTAISRAIPLQPICTSAVVIFI